MLDRIFAMLFVGAVISGILIRWLVLPVVVGFFVLYLPIMWLIGG